VQSNLAVKGNDLELSIVSVDVLADKSITVNIVATNQANWRNVLIFRDMTKIQLVSDSLDRVTAVGKPEGQFYTRKDGGNDLIELAPHDAIKLSLRFPALPQETRRVNLVAYPDAITPVGSGFNLRGIALFAGQ